MGLQALAAALPACAAPADLALTHARIYTAAGPALAEALAANNGQIVYVGDEAGLKNYLGPHTRRVDAGGRMVLPGLVDSHIHPIDLVSGDECDLQSKPRSLRQISVFVGGCIRHFHPPASSWLHVQGWSNSYGNTPDAEYATTFSWATSDTDYDMTVVPFLQHMTGNSAESRMVPGSYYFENSYPVRAVRDAGGIVVGGSDAPVWTRDPQPFVNIAVAVLRHMPGAVQLNARQALSVREALDAYTIEGARFLGREREFGSLEPGKSTDFIIVDRDLLALAERGKTEDIARTRVLETWFRGKRVYRAAVAAR
jgi:predicted amidohydrolase YtcJ